MDQEPRRPAAPQKSSAGGHTVRAGETAPQTATPVVASALGRQAGFSEEVHNYIREHIRNADAKATFFFAALTAILAFLNTQNVPARWLKDVRTWSFVDALGFVSMFGIAAGAVILLGVVFPRLKGSARGILFFKAIAAHDNPSDYAEEVLARSEHDLVRSKLQHCYELSKVCSAKYRLLRIGFWVGSVGVAATILYLLLAKSTSP